MNKPIAADRFVPNTLLTYYFGKLVWVVVLVWLGFLIGTARDQGASAPVAAEDAAPAQAVSEDWHGNVRRSGGGN